MCFDWTDRPSRRRRWKSSSVCCVQTMIWALPAAEQSPTSSRTCPTSKCSASRVRTAWNRHSSPCVGFPYDVQQYVFVAVVHCTCHMLRSMKKERESPYRCFHGMTEHHRLHSNYHRPLMPSSILICLPCPFFFSSLLRSVWLMHQWLIRCLVLESLVLI